jgi:hypothetical protein
MPQPYAPTAADLFHFLELPGDTVSDAQRRFLEPFINAALNDFEGEAGCGRKMLAPATGVQRTFSPPTSWDGSRSELWVPDMASGGTVTVAYQPTGSTSETLTAGTDYHLEPQSASDTGKPYTSLVFYRRFGLEPLSSSLLKALKVTARWGYSVTFPDDAWIAVLSRAALKMYPAGRLANTGGLLGWTHGDRKVDYGITTAKDTLSQWAADYDAAVTKYRRDLF